MTKWEPAGAEAQDLHLELVTTLGDQMALLDHAMRAPAFRRRRMIREALIVAGAPLGLALGGGIAWFLDTARVPMRAMLHDLLTDDLALTIKAVLSAYAIMTVCVLLSRLTQRAQRRRLLKTILMARPDIDKADPELSQRTTVTFGPEGIDSRTDAGSSLVRWSAIQRLDETEAYLFFVSGPFGGFIVPKRELRPGQAERLRAIAAAYLPKPARR